MTDSGSMEMSQDTEEAVSRQNNATDAMAFTGDGEERVCTSGNPAEVMADSQRNENPGTRFADSSAGIVVHADFETPHRPVHHVNRTSSQSTSVLKDSETRQRQSETQHSAVMQLRGSQRAGLPTVSETQRDQQARARPHPVESRKSKPDQQIEIIVIDDDEVMTETNMTMLEYEWKLAQSKAGRMQAAKEVEKVSLERILGFNHMSASSLKSELDLKYQPSVLDNRHESELKLRVITFDLEYYEKKVELADFHLSHVLRGMAVTEDPLGLR